jgi:carboxypeptidase C (cathepsin A)
MKSSSPDGRGSAPRKETFVSSPQDSVANTLQPGEADGAGKPTAKETRTESEHTVEINGQVVRYRAVAGTLLLKDDKEKVKASIFYVAYLKLDEDDPTTRPITFSFNGGPGSSSVWMHLGLLGPRRVLSGDVDDMLPPPHQLADNEFSLLDKSDLVFIDPVSTGFSRPGPDEDPKQFHTVETDVESVGDFIRLFVSRNDRWLSPKFLIGESYGTTRAAGLAGYLQDRHGLY